MFYNAQTTYSTFVSEIEFKLNKNWVTGEEELTGKRELSISQMLQALHLLTQNCYGRCYFAHSDQSFHVFCPCKEVSKQ
jgi:hypothetical protein